MVFSANITAFATEHHFPWVSTVHGDSIAYPNFEIVTKLNSTSIGNDSKWWCVLQVGQSGQANYRLIKSNIEKLSKNQMQKYFIL
ncbi:MAG: hypothetical protein ACQPRI_06585 [Solitalea-like symbiont of Tyrophagus putrescentiae]